MVVYIGTLGTLSVGLCPFCISLTVQVCFFYKHFSIFYYIMMPQAYIFYLAPDLSSNISPMSPLFSLKKKMKA